MVIATMTIGALLLWSPVAQAPADAQQATQWARIVELAGGSAIRATLTAPKYLLERGFLSPEGEQRRPNDRRLDGRFIAADADTLVLRVVSGGDQGVWRIPRIALARLEKVDVALDETADGYLKGLVVGAGLGLATYAGFHGSSDAFDADELPYLMAFCGVPASLLGWLVDNTHRARSFAPTATLYGEPPLGGYGAGGPGAAVSTTRRFTAGAGIALGLSGSGVNSGTGSTYAFSSTRSMERKLEFEVQVLASSGRGEGSDWSAGYYLEDDDDEATQVTGRRGRRGDDASALVRMNYVFAGQRFRPYVATGIGVGWSRTEETNVAYFSDGEEFFSRSISGSGVGVTTLLGGGADIALTHRWRLRPELIWYGVGWTRSGSFGPAVTVGVSYSPGAG